MSAAGSRSRRRTPRMRLLRALPEVFVGADAARELDGRRGFLFGEKRHRQVDVFGVAPLETTSGEAADLESLLERRLEPAAVGGWRVVGLALAPEDMDREEELLLDGAVAGDVIIAGVGTGVVRIHCGDRLAPVRVTLPGRTGPGE